MARTKRRGKTSGSNGIQTQSHCAIEQHQLSALKPSDLSSCAPNYGGKDDAVQTQSYVALEHPPCTSKPSYPSNGFPNPGGTGVISTTNTRGRKRTRDFTSASNVIQTRSRGAFNQHQPSASKPSDPSNGRISLTITRKSQKRACETVSAGDFMQIQSHVALEQHQPSASKPSDPTNGAPSFGETGVIFLSNIRKCRSMRRGRKRTLDDTFVDNDLQIQTHCALALQELSTSKSSDSSSAAPSSGGIDVSSLNDKRKDQKKSIDYACGVNMIQTQPHCALEQHQPSTLKPSDPSNCALVSTEKGVRIKLKKGRGPAKGSDDWGSGEKLHLEFNEFMEPVGVNKDKFMSQLGIIARNGQKVPLTYTSWSEVPSEVLNSLWREVQENTNAPLEYCANCLKSIGKLWRNWKHQVKSNHYVVHETDEERLSYVPPRVIDDQWKTLVKYWGSEQARNITDRNKANRELQGLPHRTGRKGFSDIRFKMQQEGESTDRVSLWVKTRTPSFGAQHDPIATEDISIARKRTSGNTSKSDAIQTQSHFALEQLQPSALQPSDHSCIAPNSGGAGNVIRRQSYSSLEHQPCASKTTYPSNGSRSPGGTGVSSSTNTRKDQERTCDNTSPSNVIQTHSHCAFDQHQPSTSKPSDPSNAAPSSGVCNLANTSKRQKRTFGAVSLSDFVQTHSHDAVEQPQPSASKSSDPLNRTPNFGEAGQSFLTNTRKGPTMRKGQKRTLNNASSGNGIQMQTHCALSQQQFSLSNSSDSSNAAPSSSGTGASSLNDERIRLNGILDDASVVNVIERQIQYGLEQHLPSTSTPSDPSNCAPNSIETGVRIKTRKGRGPAKGFDDWGSGEKLHVDFNEFMQPIGVNKDKFMSQLGMIARNGQKVSLTYTSWKKVPPEVLDSIWSEVQENTNAPLEYRASCLKAIGRLWRNWKHQVKANHYLVHETDEKRLSYVPPRVIDDQWKALVEYWGSEQARNVTNRNKANRELQGLPHRTGRKGFSEIRFQMQQEGESTDRVSVWVKTRTPKCGSQLDPKTKEVISKLNDRLSQVPELEQTPELREEIFVDVMGSDGRGRVRTFGAGPSRKDVHIQTSKVPIYEMLVKVRTEMQEQASVREKRMQEEFAAAQSQMQAQLDMMRSCLEKAGITMPSSGVQVPNASSVHETPTPSSA